MPPAEETTTPAVASETEGTIMVAEVAAITTTSSGTRSKSISSRGSRSSQLREDSVEVQASSSRQRLARCRTSNRSQTCPVLLPIPRRSINLVLALASRIRTVEELSVAKVKTYLGLIERWLTLPRITKGRGNQPLGPKLACSITMRARV